MPWNCILLGLFKFIFIDFWCIDWKVKLRMSYRHKSCTNSCTVNHVPVLLTNLCLLVWMWLWHKLLSQFLFWDKWRFPSRLLGILKSETWFDLENDRNTDSLICLGASCVLVLLWTGKLWKEKEIWF